MATALAIAEALQELFQGFPVQVKWPNDLWVHQKKLGGILCEAVGSRVDAFVVIGIGLNCAVAPEGLDQPTTSVSAELGKSVSADDVRSTVIKKVIEWMTLDVSKIAEFYGKLAALTPLTRIQWADGAENGFVLGLGPSGELRVRKESGEEVSLFAEDVKVRISR